MDRAFGPSEISLLSAPIRNTRGALKARSISAWGEAPGLKQQKEEGLKARPKKF